MDITFEFACRDDCLNQMVPGDLRKLVSERDALRAFAKDIMRAWPEGDVDGGDLQDLAERHGLLRAKIPAPTEPCGECCTCAEHYGDMADGMTCCLQKHACDD